MELLSAKDYEKLNFGQTSVMPATIGPDFASFVIKEKNPKNRSLSERKVRPIVHCMNSGNFQFNGESIVFDSNGYLIDGQHRLSALAESGKNFKFVLATGLPPEAQATIDTGSTRSLSDTFMIEGVKNSIICASILNALIQVEDSIGKKGFASNKTINNAIKLDVFNHVESNSAVSIVESANFACTNRDRLRNYNLSPKIAGTIHYMIARSYDTSVADSFFKEIIDGTSDSPFSGTALVRDRLLSSLRAGNARFKSEYFYAILTKGFNLWTENKEAKRINYNTDKEKFPSIISYEKVLA